MRIIYALPLCLMALTAQADTAADKGFLTNWLEKNLSGAGRIVTIDGFRGALSSQASLDQLTIADSAGVWLTLKDVTLDWSQAALLTGRVSVTALTAGEIDLERLPLSEETSALPTPEAKPFELTLPDLPVSIEVKSIAAEKVVLGAAILGQPVEASIAADLTLADGEGASHLTLQRLGSGPQGHVTLAASYSNSTKILGLSLDAAEDAGGIAASLLHMPGTPATSLALEGKGPLSDFAASVTLASDGQTRLTGQLTQKDDAEGLRSFAAALSGDPTPVFLPEYASFFGPNVALQVNGRRLASGALQLDKLAVQSQALNLEGSLNLAADGQPEKIALTGTLGLAAGPVTLPLTTAEPIKVGHADLSLSFDSAQSPLWHLATTVAQFDSGSVKAGLLKLTAEGQLQDRIFNGSTRFSALSLALRDPGLALALGKTLVGSGDFSWDPDTTALKIGTLNLTGPGFAAQTSGSIGHWAEVQGKIEGHVDDLSRLSTLAGRPLSGAARFALDGTASPVSGAFDVTGTVQGQAIGLGQPEVDQLFKAQSNLGLSVRRDETGTAIRALTVTAASLSAKLAGSLASTGADLTGTLAFGALSDLGPGYGGSLSADLGFTGLISAGAISAQIKGQDLKLGQAQADGLLVGASTLTLAATLKDGVAQLEKAEAVTSGGRVGVTGTASVAQSNLTATLDLPDLAPLGAGFHGKVTGTATFSGSAEAGALGLDVAASDLALGQAQADRLLRGASKVSARLALSPAGLRILGAEITNPELTAKASGTVDGPQTTVSIEARLRNLGLLYPEFPGPVTVSGSIAQGSAGTRLDLVAKGPGQIDAKVNGTVAADFSTADLTASGTAQAALANAFVSPRQVAGALRFDLALKGPLALTSLSGPVTISKGRLVDPSLTFGLTNLAATATLGNERLAITATSGITTGGSLAAKGTVGLSAPYTADLTIDAKQAALKDPDLYATKVDGRITFRGPAMGGATIAGTLSLDRTEVRIPSTGAGADGGLPGLKHRHEPAAVKATRVRAGQGGSGAAKSASRGYLLNLTILAPNQVFIRGRGLDAELGGSIVLRGSTTAISPSGSFNLIRGRLDILGKRMVLSEAQFQLQGAMVPYVHVLASVESDDITATVQIDGEATDPTVSFTSSPELPQEEVLSHLLFNQGLANVTPFQAAQLASAVSTLAGKGGDGLLGNLRRKTGLDNLDVQSDGTGSSSLTAGKYLSDKTYSEVTVDQAGKSAISLNYDVARHITLKGHVDSEGSSSVGVYLKRDY